MRIGVARVGRIGAFHARTPSSIDDTDTLVLADTLPTATDAHAALILPGVDAGIPVFCEKPVAPDAAGTRAVLDKVRTCAVPVQIGFQRRFDVGFAAARAAVAAGELGWVHTLRATTLDPAAPTAEYAEHRAARVDEVRA
jgi:myo-inositol 2-dehydrogenase / D-chiro-inositol 1-dehydrogenase